MLEVLQTNLQSATSGSPDQKKVRLEDKLGYRPDVYRMRELHGSWERPYDFSFTLAGFVLGFYTLWRFPYLCYKFGTVFYVPYIIMLFFVGVPILYMEFTIGQYLSIGPTFSFGSMAPIITGISYLVTWNSLISSWLYVMLFSWTRWYGGVSTSCGRGWEKCQLGTYYNTMDCYTGLHDLECDNLFLESLNKSRMSKDANITELSKNREEISNGKLKIYWNFTCTDLEVFCNYHKMRVPEGVGISQKNCIDKDNHLIDIYERRNHAASEYFLGAVCGMIRRRHLSDYNNTKIPKNTTEDQYARNSRGNKLVFNHKSTSGDGMLLINITSWIMFILFLRDDILSVSVFAYLINFLPYLCLLFFTIKALSLEYAIDGIGLMFSNKGINMKSLGSIDMWTEAGIQVICTTGVGLGVLINLSSLNRFRHRFIFDIGLTCIFNIATSTCALVICFCTIGHYRKSNGINTEFSKFVVSDSNRSSVEFGFIVYSQFLFFMSSSVFVIFLFFFMITAFSTDSALRLVHQTLSATMEVVPALRHYRTTTLMVISVYGAAALYPMCKNGGLDTFVEYEFLTIEIISPLIVFIETILVGWIYRGERIFDNSEEMGVSHSKIVRAFITYSLRAITPGILLIIICYRLFGHWFKKTYIFSGIKRGPTGIMFGYAFVFGPLVLLILSFLDIWINNRKKPKSWFIYPIGQQQRIYMHQLKAHAFGVEGIKIDHGGPSDEKDDERYAEYLEALRDAGLDEVEGDESKSNMEKMKEWLIDCLVYMDKWPGRFRDYDSESSDNMESSDESGH